MENQFTLSCCSTVDLPYAYMASRHIPVLFYTYVVDGTEYDDDMGRDPAALPRFYGFIRQGKLPQTSQINVAAYMDFFEKLLQTGDVLHIAFTSGQSGSVHNAFLAAEELRKKYPDRKLVVIDSLCSSSGYGLLVDCAADLRDEGKSLDEVAQWVATVLNICPIMRLDDTGSIKAYSKVRGKKKAVEVTVDTMEQHAQGGRDYDGKCFVCHSDCPEDARMTIQAIEDRFPKLKGKIRLCDIGTIIGSHAGPGTVAAFFLGDERPHMD